MKSFTTLLLIFLTLVSVESDGNKSQITNITSSSIIHNISSSNINKITKNMFSTNLNNNFNTSIIGLSDASSSATLRDKRGEFFFN